MQAGQVQGSEMQAGQVQESLLLIAFEGRFNCKFATSIACDPSVPFVSFEANGTIYFLQGRGSLNRYADLADPMAKAAVMQKLPKLPAAGSVRLRCVEW